MDLWHDKNWFAVQTKPACENLAQAQLAARGIEVFFPRLARETQRRGRLGVSTRSLFPGYLFARFVPLTDLDRVRFASGVLRVIGTAALPIPIELSVLETLRARLDRNCCLRIVAPPLNVGDQVTVESGPLQGFVGLIERETNDRKRVILLLDVIDHARVSIEKSALLRLAAAA